MNRTGAERDDGLTGTLINVGLATIGIGLKMAVFVAPLLLYLAGRLR